MSILYHRVKGNVQITTYKIVVIKFEFELWNPVKHRYRNDIGAYVKWRLLRFVSKWTPFTFYVKMTHPLRFVLKWTPLRVKDVHSWRGSTIIAIYVAQNVNFKFASNYNFLSVFTKSSDFLILHSLLVCFRKFVTKYENVWRNKVQKGLAVYIGTPF